MTGVTIYIREPEAVWYRHTTGDYMSLGLMVVFIFFVGWALERCFGRYHHRTLVARLSAVLLWTVGAVVAVVGFFALLYGLGWAAAHGLDAIRGVR